MADYLGTPPEIEPADLVDELDAVLARITRRGGEGCKDPQPVIETEGYRRSGYSSATAMLKHRNSMHPNAASQMVARANNLFGANSVPLDVGRAQRFVTPGMRKAVDARDLCDAHHIIHWIDGGETCVANLVLLCQHHHTLIHDHGWRLEGEPGFLRFYRPDGSEWSEPVPDPPPLPRQRGPILDIETIKEVGALKQQLGRASPG